MKEKTMPLYIFDWAPRYYLTHPWKWFHDLRVGLKNAWHRARCGWAWVDLWNTDCYISKLMENMIEELADRSHGWPQSDEHPEFEDWQTELHVIAKLLHVLNIDTLMEEEEFDSAFAEYRGGLTIYPLKDMSFYGKYVLTEEECAQIDNAETEWLRRNAERDILRKKLFIRISEIFDSLWD